MSKRLASSIFLHEAVVSILMSTGAGQTASIAASFKSNIELMKLLFGFLRGHIANSNKYRTAIDAAQAAKYREMRVMSSFCRMLAWYRLESRDAAEPLPINFQQQTLAA